MNVWNGIINIPRIQSLLSTNPPTQALSHMAMSMRRTLTRQGIVNLLPTWLVQILLPRMLYNKRKNAQSKTFAYRLNKETAGHLNELIDHAHEHHHSRLELQYAFIRRLINDFVSQSNMEFVLNSINPKVVGVWASASMFFVVAQILVSRGQRETLRSIVRTMVLMASLGGTGVSFGLLALHTGAERFQKKREQALVDSNLLNNTLRGEDE